VIAEISLRDPVHFVVWLTGAAVWTVVALVLMALILEATRRALRATEIIAWQAIALRRGATRVSNTTWAGAWWFSFWHGWAGRTRRRYWAGCPARGDDA
jgi:hypothetical protein